MTENPKNIDYPLDGIEVRDTTFSGDGTPVESWVLFMHLQLK
jgi:hypothetical protein